MYYGDLGKRIVASILDSIIVSAASTIIWYVLWMMFGFSAVFIAPGVCTLFSVLYFILMEGGSLHATLGKRIMGMYVADADGNGITYSTSILRMLGKVLSALIFCVGYLMAFFDKKNQTLHDMIAKTYVLNGEPQGGYGRSAAGYVPNVNSNAPQLVGISGPLAGMVYPVGGNGLVIGRDSLGCQVVIPASQAKVSRMHCYLTFNPMSGMFVLNDRNSTHGTFLANGNKISYAQPAALRSGDRFYLATRENTFEVR